MADLFENPMGLCGFEFVEFTAPERGVIEPVFEAMGFSHIANHRSKDVELWRQGGINFLINYEPETQASFFAKEHGPSACGMGFRVKDAAQAYEECLERGAEPVLTEPGISELVIPAVKGIGGASVYLIDRFEDGKSIYDIDFVYLDGVDIHPEGCGFNVIDHLTHNVYKGRMDYWAKYYEDLFNFREIRFFDIKGKKTGLTSYALASPCGTFSLPINESSDEKSQIEEYLNDYNGPGIQHLALSTHDLLESLDAMEGGPIETLDIDKGYYEEVFDRVPNVVEDHDRIEHHDVLVDGDEDGYLLQIFTKNIIGPIFFELIQRKNHKSFGEGNFQALFESIERDQEKRGVI